jgi:group II intron reverse transcriptase/maturase
MTLCNGTKSLPISKSMVFEAYKHVKSNKGACGVDNIGWDEFEENKSSYLYKLWNRLSSGSYFPPPVKEVEISKKDGGIRRLGVPTISDRIAQQVVKYYLEPRFEAIFSTHSYGYRPGRSAHQALKSVEINCRKLNWVIDFDIKGFFDNIDHKNLMLAIRKHVSEKWVLLYIQRWLEMPIQKQNGELEAKEGKGTPQGGVISPLLANLYLHYAFDVWVERLNCNVKFARYADDAIIHCHSQEQARWLLEKLNKRMQECKLELHPQKTKIVYCKDYRRNGNYNNVKFDFLGFSFQPRRSRSSKYKGIFLGYGCAISRSSQKEIGKKISELVNKSKTCKSIVGFAKRLNPALRGWVNYYGKFRLSEMHKVFRMLHARLVGWVRNRYKRYKYRLRGAYDWLKRVRKQYPNLFYHWRFKVSI